MLIVTRNSYNKQVVSLLSGLIAPVATAATSVTGTSFVANWNAYDGATTYYLDVSTSPTFATFVLQNQSVSAPATSYTVTGLTACTYYYYRVRAEGNKPTISIAPTLSPSGTQFTGTLITCGTGTWNNQGSTFNYQWKRNGVSISGATSSTYTLQVADEGTTITCEVQNQNAFGKSPYVVTSNSVSASAFQGVLDLYPNAAAAYSVRKLRTAYTGSAIRVRRSSDNTEQDIGFVNNVLDTSSLTSFCGSGNGFVTTWYDQSGNARNATQTTAANQPQIVSSGSVINVNSKPSLKFDGSNDEFSLSSTITTSIYSNFVVLKKTSTGSIVIPSGLANGQLTGAWSDSNLYENNGSFFSYVPYTNNTNQNLFSVIKIGNTLSDFSATQNASTLGSYLGTAFASISTDRLGARIGTYSDGNLQEIILYSLNQSSNRTGILSNINTYYGIY